MSVLPGDVEAECVCHTQGDQKRMSGLEVLGGMGAAHKTQVPCENKKLRSHPGRRQHFSCFHWEDAAKSLPLSEVPH